MESIFELEIKRGDILYFKNRTDMQIVNYPNSETPEWRRHSIRKVVRPILVGKTHDTVSTLMTYHDTNYNVRRVVMSPSTDLYRYEIIWEYNPILDIVERRYLDNVIAPFRDKVEYIVKEVAYTSAGEEYITIALRDDVNMIFPYFKEGTMYKGMELDKKYTLKELELEK